MKRETFTKRSEDSHEKWENLEIKTDSEHIEDKLGVVRSFDLTFSPRRATSHD